MFFFIIKKKRRKGAGEGEGGMRLAVIRNTYHMLYYKERKKERFFHVVHLTLSATTLVPHFPITDPSRHHSVSSLQQPCARPAERRSAAPTCPETWRMRQDRGIVERLFSEGVEGAR